MDILARDIIMDDGIEESAKFRIFIFCKLKFLRIKSYYL